MILAYSFAGSTMTVLVSGEETGGSFSVLHVIKPPNNSTPPHSHDEETELAYVLSGALGVETEGRNTIVGEGEFVVLPPARSHRLFNESGANSRWFELFRRPRPAAFRSLDDDGAAFASSPASTTRRG